MNSLNFVGVLFLIMMLFALYNATETGPFIFKNNILKKVNINRDSFEPNDISVNLGDQVLWKNMDHVLRHTVVNDDPLIRNSDVLLKGKEFKVIFDRPGEYIFYSSLYPEFERGIVRVIPVKSGSGYRKDLKENVLTVVFKLWRIVLKSGNKLYRVLKNFLTSYMTMQNSLYFSVGLTLFLMTFFLYKKYFTFAQTVQIQITQ